MSILDETSGVSYATVSAAILGSSANDVLQIPAGAYVEDFPDITHSLTIEAVGGMASLSNPQPLPPNGRAILNVPGDLNINLSVSGLELSGANNDPSAGNPGGPSNGAGILFEVGNDTLTVTDCWIHGNEDGMLIGGADSASLSGAFAVITNSQIDDNGAPQSSPRYGYDHNIYAGELTQLTVTGSYLHDAQGGHEIKSHALSDTITDNRIEDGATAQTSYSIDLEDGGNAVVSGNTIEKGAASSNKYVIHIGGETTYPGTSLQITGNTLINDRPGGAVALLNQSQDSGGANIPAEITGNSFQGFDPNDLSDDSGGTRVDAISGNTFSVPCFRAATRILTSRGPVAVEHLRPGDRVVLADGRRMPVKWAPVTWIGHRRVDCRRHPRPQDVLPVRVQAGAFGPGLPARDLFLSPDHAVFAEGVLIPVRHLVNATTVRREQVPDVTYYHVELPSHDVILAEGLPCESYLDTGNRIAFANGGPAMALHPDFALHVREAESCARLVVSGAELMTVRTVLRDRAACTAAARAMIVGRRGSPETAMIRPIIPAHEKKDR